MTILLLLSSVILGKQEALAQNGPNKKFGKIEFYAGAGPAWLQIKTVARTTTYENNLPFYGYSFGLSFKRKIIARKAEFVLRIEFDRKGGSFFSANDSLYNSSGKPIGLIAPHSEIYILDYLSMPFVIQRSLGKSNNYSLGMGGYVSKLLNSKFETYFTSSGSSSSRAVSGLESLDFGATLLAKAGGSPKILSGKLGVLIMLNYGLYNICQYTGTSIKPRSLVLTMTYRLK